MAFTTFAFFFLCGAFSLHYSFGVSLPPCLPTACKCTFNTTYITDDNGCQTCSCLPDPCPQLNCLNKVCPYGFEAEGNCMTCRCKTQPVCPEYTTDVCIHGTTIDAYGCKVCRNNTVSCKPQACPKIHCPNGYRRDEYGCSTCDCNPPICPEYSCPPREVCEQHELIKDSNGCLKCRCKCALPICPRKNCTIGFVTGTSGCRICKCRRPVCSPFTCALACPGGFKRDENDCPLCQCSYDIV
ncbi:hypothetical protein BsWGS_02913 [Bradybaena similaris]